MAAPAIADTTELPQLNLNSGFGVWEAGGPCVRHTPPGPASYHRPISHCTPVGTQTGLTAVCSCAVVRHPERRTCSTRSALHYFSI
eukprot:6723214-Prymnesium_polylepis.1